MCGNGSKQDKMSKEDFIQGPTGDYSPKETPPPPKGEQWIISSFNNFDRKIGELEKDTKKLIDQTARLEENTKMIPEIKTDLKKIEKSYWIGFGIFLFLMYLANFIFSKVSITIAPTQ